MDIVRVADTLPDLSDLRSAAQAEGHALLERLVRDWTSGALRFDRPLETLLAARVGDTLVGIGGITQEPADPSALRMRRFYVLPAHRRRGIGRALAQSLIEAPERRGLRLTIHAGQPDSVRFWERLGFLAVRDQPYSHELRPPAL